MVRFFIFTLALNFFLLSCNTVRESAGVNRKFIDEYSVIENPPLVIPPDFNLLPPDQIQSKDILDTETELAKEILFGLEDNNEIEANNSLIKEIIREAGGNEVNNDIRETINQEFAGEKSSINDETKFESIDELNQAIKETEEKENSKSKENKTKEKKKKRFFFF